MINIFVLFLFFKQKTAYEMRISDWSSDVCSSDLRQQPARFLGEEAVLLDSHIGAVLQDLDDRGIGRRAADPQFFQPLDEARLRTARRRLGEMLLGIYALFGLLFAPTQPRQAIAVFIRGVGLLAKHAHTYLSLAAFFVARELARKPPNLTVHTHRCTARAVS